MAIVKMFYDIETTGLNPRAHSIHQIAGMIEVDGEIEEVFDYRVRPNPKAEIDPAALRVSGVTEDQIRAYPPMSEVFVSFVKILEKYVDSTNPKEGIYLCGFNNRKFDDLFLHPWFMQNGDSLFFGRFRTESLDVMVLAGEYLLDRRQRMPSFKLHRVATELGLVVGKRKLHGGVYDVQLTYDIYNIVTGRVLEI